MSRSVIPTVALAAALVLSAACADDSGDNPFAVTVGEQGAGDEPQTPDSLDTVLQAGLDDVERFWTETYPDVYGDEFEPVAGGFHPYGPDTEQPPCGNPPPSYEEIAENAFYCPSDDLIAWDAVNLIPQLADEFGPFTVGIVMAHEYGHAIQAPFRADVVAPSVIAEMQADCFAGAWTAWIGEGNSESFDVSVDELDRSVAGMLDIRDAVGSSPDDPLAHGSGFDRIGSFQDGFRNGAAKCAAYADEAPPIVEIPFTSEEDFATEGNLELVGEDGLLALAVEDLNAYYELVFDEVGQDWEPIEDLRIVDEGDDVSCDGDEIEGDLGFASGYCADENIVVLGEDLTVTLNDEIGDFAVASELSRLWAQAAQLQLGVDVDDEKSASLQADCLTGVWAFLRFPTPDGELMEGQTLVLSPGDLDEAIQGFLTFGDEFQDQVGTVFERTAAIRAGFVDGLDTCEQYAELG